MAKLNKKQTRADIFVARYRADLQVRQLHKAISEQVDAIFFQHQKTLADGTKVLDEVAAANIQAELDIHLGRLYGFAKGQPGLVSQVVTKEAARARRLVRQEAVDDIQARVPSTLFDAMQIGAVDETLPG